MRYFAFAILLLLAQKNLLAAAIEDFSADYDVYQNGFYLGESRRTLTTKNNQLTLTSITQSKGIAAWFFDVKIVEVSKLIFAKNALRFHSYQYDEKQKNKHETIELRIDKPRQVYNSYTRQHYPLTQNLYDGLGFSLAMMYDLKKGQRKLNYTIAEKEHLKHYQLKFLGYEKIPTNNKAITTIKMEHYDPKSKYRFTFWCAENMHFLPVRIRNIKKNGDEITLNLTHFNHQAVYLETENEDINI